MGRPIRFLMDGEVRELAGVDPTLTVLNWLRYEARRTGTKEGCAEGDCGACTVVLGELEGERVRFRAVNACILFAPMLDGRALFTVESLSRDGDLHPVQQAMVEHHGSQCGFCTPGFVMSLYAHQREDGATDSQTLKDVLAGNLCRCTGYGPILAAGQAMGSDPQVAEAAGLAQALRELQSDEDLVVEHKGRRFVAPRTVAGLAAAVEAEPEATIVAGATDVGLWVTKQQRVLPTLISVGEVAELKRIEDLGDAIRIGAAVRYSEAAQLTGVHPELGELLRRLGGVQVRNAGTVVGNIANGSPIGDMPPALIAAGATLVLRKGGATRQLALETYFSAFRIQDRLPGELLEAVIVPKIRAGEIFKVFKLSKRFDQDISSVCVGLKISLGSDGTVSQARIAFGGMAEIPKRAAACEAAFVGQPWSVEAVTRAVTALEQDFTPISDMRASAGYRMQAAKNLILKAVVESARVTELEPADG